VHAEYNEYASTGKAAPRLIDYLDWDRDGQVELLLQHYGTADTWLTAVGHAGNEWRSIFQHRCAPPPAPAAPQDSAPADAASATRRASSQPPAPAPARQQQPAQQTRQQTAPPPDTTRRTTPPARTEPMVRPDTARRDSAAPPRQDTIRPRQDTVTRRDTLQRDTLRRDTLRLP
jgi:hypothetical protein